jgi:peptidyl-prolyl cis-trans isomerase B (cyclophilin B)
VYVPSNEQRRQAAKRKLERQIVHRAERARRRRIAAVSITIATVVVVAAGVYLVVTLSGGNSQQEAAASPTQANAAPTAGPCAYTPTPDEPAAKPVTLPDDPTPTPNTGTLKVTLKTNQGDVPLTLDRAKAPCTVQSIEHLVQAKFYDNTPCHRLTTSDGLKVLQCGDPTGQGSGGPGYTIKDEPPTDLKPASTQGTVVYPRGVIAMANTGQPNSGGSQFFLVYADSTLPPQYTVFGTIDPTGLDTIDKIAAAGVSDAPNPQTGQADPTDGAPKNPVTIQQAVVAN